MSLDVSTTRTVSEVLDTVLTHTRPYQWYAFDAAVACTAIWTLLRWIRASRQQLCTTQLRGPPNESFLYGVGKRILDAKDSGAVYEAWAQEYGPVYTIPSALGNTRIVLCDPKAVAHFYAKNTWTYVENPLAKKITANLRNHRRYIHNATHSLETLTYFTRQRKSLTPAFSIAAIRQLTSIFYDSAYKQPWDVLIESSGGGSSLIEVQNWMNHISLDAIGLGGFSHNFGALEGKHAQVTEVFDSFGASPRSSAVNNGLFLLAQAFPFLTQIPTSRRRLMQNLNVAMEEISNVLLIRTEKELEMGVVWGKEENAWSIPNFPLHASLICSTRTIVKGAKADSEFHLTKDEVIAQMNVLLIAGYETTSVTLTWALLELSRNPDVQTKLRSELIEHGADPTYDQLTNGLPYLDAVVHEILRIHPPIAEQTRVANEDDVIPLSEPIRTKCWQVSRQPDDCQRAPSSRCFD
ncbi:cytochrome P450 [Lanmaoa asiatica]|nr:cytochrome P450 [Lanmaoa asiatica]